MWMSQSQNRTESKLQIAMTAENDLWLDVAVIGRPHGVRGALYVHFSNTESSLIVAGQKFKLQAPVKGKSVSFSFDQLVIDKARRTQKGWLVTFIDVDDRDKAQALTHSRLLINRSVLPPTTDEAVYLVDLMGLTVVDQEENEIGCVKGFFFNGAHEVITVELTDGGEVLLPFTEGSLVDLDLANELVTLYIPDGLPGLNDR